MKPDSHLTAYALKILLNHEIRVRDEVAAAITELESLQPKDLFLITKKKIQLERFNREIFKLEGEINALS